MLRRWLVCAALVIGVAGEALAQARPGSVDIMVSVTSRDSTHVEERYVLAPSPSPIELKVLTRPCVSINNMQLERGGLWSGLAESRSGPWITYRDTTAWTDTVRLLVRYAVRPGGTGVIPLVHLASAVGVVSVTVRFDDDARRVNFPHMTRQAPGEWSARYVAAPSFIEVSGPGLTDCDEGGEGRGDNGGLVWRFFLLVGIMVAWVPLYLAWARRSSENA